MKKITFKQVIYLILIAILLIFTFQNLSNAMVTLLFFSFELPLVILIVIVFFMGYFTAKIFESLRKERKDKTEE